jgi:hypothetical protein
MGVPTAKPIQLPLNLHRLSTSQIPSHSLTASLKRLHTKEIAILLPRNTSTINTAKADGEH